MGRCPTPCASPTPSSSAGTTSRAAARSPPYGSPSTWSVIRRSISSPWRAGTVTRRSSRGGRRSRWPPSRWRGRGSTRAGCDSGGHRSNARQGPVDVCHATVLVPAPTRAPLVVTVHDLAFVRAPEAFTKHGVSVMRRSLELVKRHADIVICPSMATMADVEAAGIGSARLRHVPHGVDATVASADDVDRVRARHDLPAQFVLFVGTIEPRKNLERLVQAVAHLDEPLPLVIAGADGWGGVAATLGRTVRRHPLSRLRRRPGSARSVRGGDRVRLPQRVGGLRDAGGRGDGAGDAGDHQSRDLDRRGRRWRSRPHRPARRRRHRARSDHGARRSRPVARRRPRACRGDDVGGRDRGDASRCTSRPVDDGPRRGQPPVVHSG